VAIKFCTGKISEEADVADYAKKFFHVICASKSNCSLAVFLSPSILYSGYFNKETVMILKQAGNNVLND